MSLAYENAASRATTNETLCGTCKHWDSEHILSIDGSPATTGHDIALCLWGKDLVLPEWCNGLKGYPYTNELGTTQRGCAAYERKS